MSAYILIIEKTALANGLDIRQGVEKSKKKSRGERNKPRQLEKWNCP